MIASKYIIPSISTRRRGYMVPSCYQFSIFHTVLKHRQTSLAYMPTLIRTSLVLRLRYVGSWVGRDKLRLFLENRVVMFAQLFQQSVFSESVFECVSP